MRRLSLVLLCALVLPFTSVAPAATPRTLTIVMQSRYYQPNPIRLSAGEEVRLQLVNRDGATHSFEARRFFRSARVISGDVKDGKIELAPGETASITLVPAKGSYKVDCSHLRMDKLGMQGQIIVE